MTSMIKLPMLVNAGRVIINVWKDVLRPRILLSRVIILAILKERMTVIYGPIVKKEN